MNFLKSPTAGYCWDVITQKRLEEEPNNNYLEKHGYKVYSQNDEDGIIAEIFNRIGTTNKKFIEFGVENGLECNTHYLLFKGWTGLWIEGNRSNFQSIKKMFNSVIEEKKLYVLQAYVGQDNVNALFECRGFTGEIDLLSIDVDGNDLHIFEAITAISPRVVVVEYNAKFPPDCEWTMKYNFAHAWDGSDRHGASLKSLELAGGKKGYKLIGTNISGCNAFFVREDLWSESIFAAQATAENLYNPCRFNYMHFVSGHPSNSFLLGKSAQEMQKEAQAGDIDLQSETNSESEIILPEGSFSGLKNGDVIITVDLDSVTAKTGEHFSIDVKIDNKSQYNLESIGAHTVSVCYHIEDAYGNVIIHDGLRTPLTDALQVGLQANFLCTVEAPETPGEYMIKLTMVQEGCLWFEDFVKDIIREVKLTVE